MKAILALFGFTLLTATAHAQSSPEPTSAACALNDRLNYTLPLKLGHFVSGYYASGFLELGNGLRAYVHMVPTPSIGRCIIEFLDATKQGWFPLTKTEVDVPCSSIQASFGKTTLDCAFFN